MNADKQSNGRRTDVELKSNWNRIEVES